MVRVISDYRGHAANGQTRRTDVRQGEHALPSEALVALAFRVGGIVRHQNGRHPTAPEGQHEAKNTASDTVAVVEQKAKEAGNDAANAGAEMGDKIDDAMITTSVKTELAKAPNLSALKINVDTAAGPVALKGTAPTAAAREQATTLAQNVKGVVSVDNQLTVQQYRCGACEALVSASRSRAVRPRIAAGCSARSSRCRHPVHHRRASMGR